MMILQKVVHKTVTDTYQMYAQDMCDLINKDLNKYYRTDSGEEMPEIIPDMLYRYIALKDGHAFPDIKINYKANNMHEPFYLWSAVVDSYDENMNNQYPKYSDYDYDNDEDTVIQ